MEYRRFWKGSYTLEAAVVLSLTFFILMALLVGCFYVHDRAVFQSLVCEAAAAGSCFATEKERTEAVQKVSSLIQGSRFMGSRQISGSASAGSSEVQASWSAVYPAPGFAAKYLLTDYFSIQSAWTSRIADPVPAIRLIRGAGELITGGDN